MPITSSAKKALRVSQRKTNVNTDVRSRMRTAIKGFRTQPTGESLSEAFSRIDRAVKGKILHRTTAARKKSQLAKRLAAQVQSK
jgi:small subunit ribosomal protein S20